MDQRLEYGPNPAEVLRLCRVSFSCVVINTTQTEKLSKNVYTLRQPSQHSMLQMMEERVRYYH